MLGSMFSIACYINDAFPSLVYLVYKYLDKDKEDFEGCFAEAVLASTNCGGENCHRLPPLYPLTHPSVNPHSLAVYLTDFNLWSVVGAPAWVR